MMKYFFSLLLLLHGTFHLVGFIKAFKLVHIELLTANISKIAGLFWLLAFMFFVISGLAYLLKADWWYILALIAVFVSTILIINLWTDAKYGSLANILIMVFSIVGYGTSNFRGIYENDVKTGLKQDLSITESVLNESDIEYLPEPVKKYIRYSGSLGKPKVHNFRLEFTGQIRKDINSEWMPFTTVQYNFLNAGSRLFFMNAVMKQLPVAGYHCFKDGEAFMDIRLFSLFKVQYQSGEEMDISETVTFFNDMCCMAPATLIDKRIKWIETDGNNVKAEFTNNNITISAWLYFNESGELINFISNDRYAYDDVLGMRRLPWSTPLTGNKELDGFNLATNAEAIYTYPEGDFCYGTFTLTHVSYNCIKFIRDEK